LGKPAALLMLLVVALLVCWTAVDPLHFERSRDSVDYDSYGNPLRSSGACVCAHPWAWYGSLVAIIWCLLLSGTWTAYRARNVPSRYQESKYVALVMASNLQILAVGLPVLFLASPSAMSFYLLRASIIFLQNAGLLLLIFAPKVHAHYTHDTASNNRLSKFVRTVMPDQSTSARDGTSAASPGGRMSNMERELNKMRIRAFEAEEELHELREQIARMEAGCSSRTDCQADRVTNITQSSNGTGHGADDGMELCDVHDTGESRISHQKHQPHSSTTAT